MRPILVLLSDHFAEWETPLISGAARSFYDLDVRLTSPQGGEVRSMGGMRVTGLDRFAPAGGEVVVICGGPGWEAAGAETLMDALAPTLETARAAGSVLAGICGGVRPLARGGFLARRRHTGNSREWLTEVAPGYEGSNGYADQAQAVRDRDIITAAGTAPVSFALEVLGAAGLAPEKLRELREAITAEHRG